MEQNPNRTITGLIWVTAFILANLRATVLWDLLKQGFGLTFLPWIEILIWFGIFLLAVWALKRDGALADHLLHWRRNWLLALFIAMAFLSLLWSVSPAATLYRSSALLFSSLIGAYLGTRYSARGFLEILYRFGTLLLIFCFVLAVFFPMVGAMMWEPYNGAWRGIFWHKNQFGPMAAFFGMVFLFLALENHGRKDGNPLPYLVFYLFSLVNVFFSKSVAGYIVAILTTFAVILAFGWLRLRSRLRPIHYYSALGMGMFTAVLLAINLDFVFGIFNRDTSLTGRLPLWDYLLREVILERPWQGYGFGAFWSLASNRIQVQSVLGWLFPVAIGDNGFLDILLNLGLAGLLLFLAIYIPLGIRGFRQGVTAKTWAGFLPFLTFLYIFIGNLTYSFLLEVDQFVWMLLVVMVFATTLPKSSKIAHP